MPKITVARQKLYTKWFSIISGISKSQEPNQALILYLQSNLNTYNAYIFYLITREIPSARVYEKHHIFPKSVGGPDER
jgi:hypothetical protein